MNRATRDKMVSGTDRADLTTGNAVWETPPIVFEKLNEDFGPFDIDLTADWQRHLCPIWLGPDSPVGVFDALAGEWCRYGANGYSNPPYGPFIQQMLKVAKAEAALGMASTLLLPMRVTKAFKAHILRGASDLIFPDKRLTFFEQGVPRLNVARWKSKGKATADPAVFDSIIVRYQPGVAPDARPRLDEWHVPKHVTADDLARAVARLQLAA